MIVIGLTGSIGMGKSTTADLFKAEGIPVHDADKIVHELYDGPNSAKVEAAFPGVVIDGKVDRALLGARVLGNPDAMKKLEAIVHPMVRDAEQAFLKNAEHNGDKAVLMDIPLLFETGGENRVDVVVVVSAPEEIQRERVLARPGMTPEKFEAILAKQVPDAEKRKRADYVINTADGIENAKEQVRAILQIILSNAHGNHPAVE